MTLVRLEPAALRSGVKHSTTEPLRSQCHALISACSDKHSLSSKELSQFSKETMLSSFRNYNLRTFSILPEKCKLFDPNMPLEIIRIDIVHKAMGIVTRQKFDPYSWSHCYETLYCCPGNTPIRLLSTLYGTGLS